MDGLASVGIGSKQGGCRLRAPGEKVDSVEFGSGRWGFYGPTAGTLRVSEGITTKEKREKRLLIDHLSCVCSVTAQVRVEDSTTFLTRGHASKSGYATPNFPTAVDQGLK